jgi:tRNA threonylcarbamoyl adenosine modification protein YeaZ
VTAVALEGAGRPGTVALRVGDEVREAALSAGAAHASDLLPTLDRLLAATPDAGPVRAVFVGTGPGSFTGLRVAIATAMGIARGTGADLRGVPSLEAMAFAELAPGEEACIVLDARARELYFARYRRTEGDVEVLAEPRVVPVGAPLELPRDARVFTEEAVLGALAPSDVERASTAVRPSAAAVLRLGELRLAELGPTPPSDVEPLYLRPFAAVPRRR